MKRIGILTYHWVANFGANLQALSTYNYLKKNGCDPIIINWIPSDWEKTKSKQQDFSLQFKEHSEFIKKYVKTTDICRGNKDIAKIIIKENIEKVLIGSDAVFFYLPFWERIVFPQRYNIRYINYSRPLLQQTLNSPFLGGFKKKCNVDISVISASAQNCNYKKVLPFIEKRKLWKRIKNFSTIYVRDVWTKNMFESISNGQICPDISPDPVFAFNNNAGCDYLSKKEICEKYNLPNKYILFSVSSRVFPNEWITELEKICISNNVVLVELPRATLKSNIVITRRINNPLPVIDWYYLIKYSDGYIGELMHPIIVSLHNSVPIFSIDTYGFFDKNGTFDKTSSKIFQILERFDLLSNYYHLNYTPRIPTPQEVYQVLLLFDKSKCSITAKVLYEEYSKMMTNSLK